MSALHLSRHALARLRSRGVWLVLGLGLIVWLVAGRGIPALEPVAPAQQTPGEPVGAVDDDDLVKAGANNENWLMYGRTYNAHRYSPLKQINTKNVRRARSPSGPSRPACSTASNARRWSSTASCT